MTTTVSQGQRIVIIGAGVGGLTAAACLASAGLDVAVLESHIYPGGCAGTFYHQGFRFDAGATLAAGFYPGGPMERVGQEVGVEEWPVCKAQPAMVVHMPDGSAIERMSGEQREPIRRAAFGPESKKFWDWQENAADALWNLALRLPAWPPQALPDVVNLVKHGASWLGADFKRHIAPGLVRDAFLPVGFHLREQSDRLRLFVDAQLLIASQTTSRFTNGLYGASALDLPRRGVAHVRGGMGTIARTLATALQQHGGQIHYRQRASKIVLESGRPVAVETEKGLSLPADVVVINLPPWNTVQLLDSHLPKRFRRLASNPRGLGGAFMIYVGLDGAVVPPGLPLHHQVIIREPLGQGNTVFLSLSPDWDMARAPNGRRALTMSTHTDLSSWWELHERDRTAYQARKAEYVERVFAAADVVLPGIRDAAELTLPGTPVTFHRFTKRVWGWVGGFPQTSLLRAWGPRVAPGVWMVGDSIFPGQSVPAVALGGMRVAAALQSEL